MTPRGGPGVRQARDRIARAEVPLTPIERSVIKSQLDGASRAVTARAAGIGVKRAETLIRSRRVQEALRAAYVDAGITEEFLAQKLYRMFNADKQVLTPDGMGGWIAMRETDWKVFAEAMRLYLGMHEKLGRLEADDEPDPDRQIEDVVDETERAGLTRADLFRLYRERMSRKHA